MANLHGRQVETVSRSMLKSALECAYIDLGYDKVISPEWDDVRAAVVHGGYQGHVAIAMQAEPGTGPLQLRYQPGSLTREGYRIWVELNVYGLRLFTALGHPLPTSFIPNALQVLAFPSGRYGGDVSLELEFDYRERRTVSRRRTGGVPRRPGLSPSRRGRGRRAGARAPPRARSRSPAC